MADTNTQPTLPAAQTVPVDPLVQSLLARFTTPPATPNIIPFQQAKAKILSQQQTLPIPQGPQLQPTPTNVPPPQVTNGIMELSGPMVLMAALAGGSIGHSIAGAVSNYASFLDGIHKGDAEATKNHLEEFNTKLKAATTANQNAIDQYKLAFQQYGGEADKLKQALNGIASQEGDAVLKYKLDAGQFDEVYKIIEAREKNAEALQRKKDAMDLRIRAAEGPVVTLELKDGKSVQGSQNKITRQFQDINGNPIDADQVVRISTQEPLDENTKRLAAEGLASGDQTQLTMLLGFSRDRANTVNQVIDELVKIRPGITGQQIAALKAQYGGVKAGANVVGRTAGSVAVGAAEIPQLVPKILDTANKLDLTQYPTVNAVQNAVKRGTGNPDVVALNSYIQTLKNAYQQISARGGRISDMVRHQGDELMNGNMPVQQLAAAAQAMITEGQIVKSATGAAMNEVTGQSQPGAAPTGQQKFINGKIYEDANGNRAKYQDGQWLPVQ